MMQISLICEKTLGCLRSELSLPSVRQTSTSDVRHRTEADVVRRSALRLPTAVGLPQAPHHPAGIVAYRFVVNLRCCLDRLKQESQAICQKRPRHHKHPVQIGAHRRTLLVTADKPQSQTVSPPPP
jgi:hypothetical protein